MPDPIGLYFEFTYGTQGGLPLNKEIPLIACRAGRYMQGLRPYDLIAGGVGPLFTQIKAMKHLTFSKANQVRALDFTSHFTSAHADGRVLYSAKLIARQGKTTINTLIFINYKVVDFIPLGQMEIKRAVNVYYVPEVAQIVTIVAEKVV
jgi:hypothetical protein